MRILSSVILILCSFCAVTAEVSLSGIVKKTGGTAGIAGVSVSLSEQNKLSSITDGEGKFSITDAMDVKQHQIPDKFQAIFRGTTVEFSTDLIEQSGYIAVFSVTGKRVFFKNFDQLQPGNKSIILPRLSSGIHFFNIVTGKNTYTITFASVSNDLFLNNQPSKSTSVGTHFSLAKTALVVDTLIAVKSGYVTKKIPITSLSQKDITISLDSNMTDPHDQSKKGLTIFFIRHAETVANASGDTGGGGPAEDHDTLTSLGEKQVEELKNFLTKEKIVPDLIVVSPTWRTQKTIEPFLIATKQKGEIWVELNECCGQEQSGAPIPTVRPNPRWKMKIAVLSDNFTFRTTEDIYYWWPETYEEGLFMVMTTRDRLLEKFSQSGKTIVVVGHAVNGGILLGLLRGYDMLTTKPDRPVYLTNTGIVKLTQDTVSGAFILKQNINKPPTQ